ncbi:MAG TPA: hypothetical protein PL141_14895 [Thermoflexales bacterium]|nr:hypothetical protein [Thermoflexales bacterium]
MRNGLASAIFGASLVAGCGPRRLPNVPPPTPVVIVIEVTATPLAPADLIFVWPDGAANELRALDEFGQTRFALPAGIRTADDAKMIAASDNRITTFDMRSGAATSAITQTARLALKAISPRGEWAVLQSSPSQMQVMDLRLARARLIQMEGNFAPLAISDNGRWLYLREQPSPANPDLFLLFRLDLMDDNAAPHPLQFNGGSGPASGEILESAYTPDAKQWLALMHDRANALVYAQMIDLNSGDVFNLYLPVTGAGDVAANGAYRLAMVNGGAAYAINLASGVATEIDTASRRVTKFARFASQPQAPSAKRILAAARGEVYFASGRNVWVYDTTRNIVGGPMSLEADVVGLAAPGDGRVMLALSDGSIQSVFGYTLLPRR